MNIREDIRQLKSGLLELRKFGLLVGSVFTALGILFLLRHKAHYPWCLWPGITLIALGIVMPRALKYVYIAWMAAAIVLGFVMAHVILTLFFFLVITPIGLLARVFGKDFLGLKWGGQRPTYWIPREHKVRSASDYERQF